MPQTVGGLIIGGIIAGSQAVGATGVATGLTAAFASTAGLAVQTALGGAVLLGGSLAAQSLLAPTVPRAPAGGPGRQNEDIPIAPRRVILGRCRVGGPFVFKQSRDLVYLYRLAVLGEGEIDGIEALYIASREVIRSGVYVQSPPYYFGPSSTDTVVQLHTQLGTTGQSALSILTTDLPDLFDATDTGAGVAYILARLQPGGSANDFLKRYPNGKNIAIEALVRGIRLPDPREAGFDAADPSTWVWSENGVLAVLWHLIAPSDVGWGIDPANLDLDDIAASADDADALETLAEGGSEARSRVGGVANLDAGRGDVLRQLLRSTGTRLVWRQVGGARKLSIRLDDDALTSTLSLGEEHVRSLDVSDATAFQRPNRVRLKYLSPERDYQLADVDLEGIAWAEEATDISRWGERTLDVELPFCPSHRQAARIARREFARARAMRGEVTLDLAGMGVLGRSCVTVTLTDLGGDVTILPEKPRAEPSQQGIVVPFVEQPTLATWVPATDQPAAPVQLPEGTTLTGVEAPTIAALVHTEYSTGEMRITYNRAAGASTFEACYRTFAAEGRPNEWLPMTVVSPGGLTYEFAYATVDLEGQRVEARVRSLTSDSLSSPWSVTASTLSLAEDNSAPAAPDEPTAVFNGGTNDYTATAVAPADIDVVQLRLETDEGTSSTQPVRPGDTVSITFVVDADPVSVTAYAITSNGTETASTALVITP